MIYARAKELWPSYNDRQIGYETQHPYSPTNPSIHFDGKKWRCVIREINYRLDEGKYIFRRGETDFRNRNVVTELDDDLNVVKATLIEDGRGERYKTSRPPFGYYDLRLFQCNGEMRAIGAVNMRGWIGQVLFRFDPDWKILEAFHLEGEWRTPQKNWPPFDGLEEMRFVQDLEIGRRVDIIDGRGVPSFGGDYSYKQGMRGSSQLTLIPEWGWLGVGHDMVFTSGRKYYRHAFILCDETGRIQAKTEWFHFNKPGIEFCCGMGWDGGRELVVSYGVNDASAWIGRIRIDEVMASMDEVKIDDRNRRRVDQLRTRNIPHRRNRVDAQTPLVPQSKSCVEVREYPRVRRPSS